MAVPFWVAPTVGSAPRLPTSVKFNIWSRPFFGSNTRAVVEGGVIHRQIEIKSNRHESAILHEHMRLAEPESGSDRLLARSRAAHARAAITHVESRSDAQAPRPSLAARAAVVPRPTNGSATTSPGKLNRVMQCSGSCSGNGAGHSGSDIPGNRHSPRGPHSSNHASCGMDGGPERFHWPR